MYNNLYQNYGMRQEVIRVNGRNGAEAYQMSPSSSVLLLDETAPVIWLKTTDGAGYPTITGYEIAPLQTQEQKVYASLEQRIAKLEEMWNDKSNVKSTKPKESKPFD